MSPQTLDASLTTAEKNDLVPVADTYGLRWTAPEDLHGVYDRLGLGMAAANGDRSVTLPVPATVVIGRGGGVRYAFADPDYTKRAEPADVLAALEAL